MTFSVHTCHGSQHSSFHVKPLHISQSVHMSFSGSHSFQLLLVPSRVGIQMMYYKISALCSQVRMTKKELQAYLDLQRTCRTIHDLWQCLVAERNNCAGAAVDECIQKPVDKCDEDKYCEEMGRSTMVVGLWSANRKYSFHDAREEEKGEYAEEISTNVKRAQRDPNCQETNNSNLSTSHVWFRP